MTLRKRLYLILDPSQKGGVIEAIFEALLILIITLNIVVIILDSMSTIKQQYHRWFYWFEMFSVIFFTLEYAARLYSIVENPKYHSKKFGGRLKYALTPMAVVDLLAFLPFYIMMFFSFLLPFDLAFFRIFRLMGLFRMFKIARYLKALNVFRHVLIDRMEQLMLSIIFIFFMLIIVSSIMFYVEHEAQPTAFSSIPATMWWGVSTLTTVGYGDIIPITPLGKVLGGLFSLMGIGLFALPAGILSSGFYERMHRPKRRPRKCPHCGKDLDDD